MELLVVIAIVGILAALIFPAVSGVKQSSNRATSTAKIRAIAAMGAAYVPDHNGKMPPPQSTEYGGNMLWFEYLAKEYGENAAQTYVKRPGDKLKWITDASKTRETVVSDGTKWNWSYALNASLPYKKLPAGYTDTPIDASRVSQPARTMWFLETGQNCYLRETQAAQVYSDAANKTVVCYVDGHSEILDREKVTGPAGSKPATWTPDLKLLWMGDPTVSAAVTY